MLYGQGVQLVIQLAALPVMVAAWGLTGFGQWLLVFTLPGLLTMSDVGLVAALGNAMTTAVAREELELAQRLYASLRALLGGLSLVLTFLTVLAVALWPGWFDQLALPGGSGGAVVIALVTYAMLGVLNAAIMAGHRATDGFASSNVVLQSVVLLEALAALLTVWQGGGALAASLVYLTVRACGSLLLALLLQIRAPWLVRWSLAIDWCEVRPLLVPALSTLPLPAAYAVTLQGAVLAVAATAGVAAIPAFSATRALTRIALQMSFAINVASMPRFTIAAANGDSRKRDQLVLVNLLVSAALLIPAAITLLLLGPTIIRLWTGGRVDVDPALLAALVLAMLLNGAWVPVSNLILAVNRHAGYTWFFLGAAFAGTAGGYVAAHRFGAFGAALGVVAIEIAMVIWVWRLSLALDLVHPSRLFTEFAKQLRVLRAMSHWSK